MTDPMGDAIAGWGGATDTWRTLAYVGALLHCGYLSRPKAISRPAAAAVERVEAFRPMGHHLTVVFAFLPMCHCRSGGIFVKQLQALLLCAMGRAHLRSAAMSR
ncbi:MAG TPA: hypothetical protein VFZ16_00275 [Hyphomicrobiaceae bacterium]|nr:hypothetical protein [Hyphomicrobiaceae bacterium]